MFVFFLSSSSLIRAGTFYNLEAQGTPLLLSGACGRPCNVCTEVNIHVTQRCQLRSLTCVEDLGREVCQVSRDLMLLVRYRVMRENLTPACGWMKPKDLWSM